MSCVVVLVSISQNSTPVEVWTWNFGVEKFVKLWEDKYMY